MPAHWNHSEILLDEGNALKKPHTQVLRIFIEKMETIAQSADLEPRKMFLENSMYL